MEYYKKVLMPIEVTIGDYCWDHNRVCPHFDNQDGHPNCTLGFYSLDYDKKGFVKKPKECKELKNASGEK